MTRLFVGFAVCLAVGAVIAFSGLGRLLPLEDTFVPPPVPESWAAMPAGGRVDVTLVSSLGVLRALGDGLSGAEVAMQRPGALALVDGRIFAVSGASTHRLLRALSWEGLPIEARPGSTAELSRFTAPAPASLAWQARQHAYAGLRTSRELLAEHPSFTAAALATAILLLLQAFARGLPARHASERDERDPSQSSAWRRRRAQSPVRVVLVSDVTTLMQVRTAIGEEHVVAAAEHAFAFANGWILAVRKGSVFELVSELGWRTRPIEMVTRPELVAEGHALSPVPSDDATDALDLLEALHVCGPVAHGTLPRIASGALSTA